MNEPIQCADPRDLPPPPPPPPSKFFGPGMLSRFGLEATKKIIIEVCKDPVYGNNSDHMTSVIIALSPELDARIQQGLREHWKVSDSYVGRNLIKRIVELMIT